MSHHSALLSALSEEGELVLGQNLPFWRPALRGRVSTDLVISANELRALIVAADRPAGQRRLAVRGAVIDGILDLSGIQVDLPLEFTCCWFADDFDLRHARLRGLDLTGSAFSGRLLLTGCEVAANLTLTDATLEGRGDDGISLVGDGLRVTDDLNLDRNFSSIGAVRLTGGHISGDLVLDGANLAGFDQHRISLSADGLRVDGIASLSDGFRSAGTVRLVGASIGAQLRMRTATLNGRDADGCALVADGLSVGQDANLSPGLVTEGAVRLIGATIGGQLKMQGAALRGANSARISLLGDRLRVGDNTYLSKGFSTDGAVKLIGARLGGHLSMTDATIHGSNPNGVSLIADRLRVDDNVYFGSLNCAGAVQLMSAQVTGSLSMSGASINGTNRRGVSMAADRLRVDSRVTLGFTTAGAVRLAGARIGGQLILSGAHLRGTNAAGQSLIADGLHCERKLVLKKDFSAVGPLSFAGAEIQHLVVGDTAGELPTLGDVTGWTVQDVSGRIRTDRTAAAAWLSTQPAAQPWQALAAVYDRNGQPTDARWIRYKSAVRSTKGTAMPIWLARQAYRVTTGHGYYPLVALFWLALIFIGATTIAATSADQFTTPTTAAIRTDLATRGQSPVPGRAPASQCSRSTWDVPCLDPLTYGLSTAFPVIGATNTWTPSSNAQALAITFHTMRLLSWIFAAILLAGITGLLRKQT
ncbi:hypothetical protein [Kribbella sp. NPDC051620]|uniref:hypothetical protein n=1 Tax=Kribbella sp. NPDC051620 TaxID=3364120 RepID=UPI00378F943B